MKTKKVLFLAIAVVLLTTSSRCVNIGSGIMPSKNYITRDFTVDDFDQLNLTVVAEIYYTQSTDGKTSLQIYGSDNIVELVNVDVKDRTLMLNMKKKNVKKADLKINISTPHLKSVKIDGVGNFHIKDKIEATNLLVKSEGVGSIKINDISCRELEVCIKGVGDAYIKGKAEKADLVAQGVGNINAADLVSKEVTVTSNGVGNVSCHATQSIHAIVNGIGNISYKGNPEEKQLKKNGIGNIKQN